MTASNARRTAFAAAGFACVVLVMAIAIRPQLGGGAFILLIAPPFTAVGALLAVKRSDNPIGWLFLAFGVTATLVFAGWQYSTRALVDSPGSLPGGDAVALIGSHAWRPAFGFFVMSLLLFPDGHLVSPRWRWAAWGTVAVYGGMAVSGPFDGDASSLGDFSQVEPLFTGAVGEVGSVTFSSLLGLNLVMLPLAGASLVVRLRRSRGKERQQVKVFVHTVATVMFAFPLSIAASTDGRFAVFLLPLIPISAGIAILRYRLFDIDVVIKRTLVYGALTAVLLGIYLTSVLGFRLLLRPAIGKSDLAVAASTLAVAALFRPARSRIQAVVDRHFYRARYDAAHTVETFAVRLRDELDVESLGADLRRVVHETMQPAHVSLWLRGAP